MATDTACADFLKACVCNGPLVVEVAESTQSLPGRIVLKQPFALIGREPRADVVSQCGEVSRRHAFLQVIAGQVYCHDLNSRTGTHWGDGARHGGWIGPGKSIRIGPLSIRVSNQDSSSAPAAAWNPLDACPQGQLPFPPLTLEFLNGRSRKTQWQVDRALTLVGSGYGCKVRLRGRSVSALHCYLLATPGGAWIVDLLSTAGVFHNGSPVRFAQVQDGDRLSIGGFQIQARFGKPAAGYDSARLTPESRPHTTENYADNQALPGFQMPLGELQTFARGQALPLRLPVLGAMAQGEGEGAGLVSVMNQFSLMQMQMFEQFQQTMLMMFQMFGSLQQEQMATLRQELNRVHDLTRELQTLKDTLASSSRAEQAPPQSSKMEPSRTVPESAPRKSSPAQSQQSKAANAGYEFPSKSANGNGVKESAGPSKGPAAAAAGTKNSGPVDPNQPPPGQDLHLWLNQRMESLQQERQSRWEKILGLLGGKKS